MGIHQEYMQLALQEGRRGLGLVHPNPPVGCVIVSSSGDVIGRGAHLKFGGPHAEVNALDSVQEKELIKDATVYVTLEPCAHEGKTPSCARLLAGLPIARVIYAVEDPNPAVSGRGVEILRVAGKEVVGLSDTAEVEAAKELAEIFHWTMSKERPFIAVKVGTSLNGSLVPENKGDWLTGPESRNHVQFLRSQYDAVMVGVGTFLEDDPALNVRMENQPPRENIAIVLDPVGRGLEKLASSRLFECRAPSKIIWIVDQEPKLEIPTGIEVIKVKSVDGEFDLIDLLEKLWGLQVRSVFLEGGAKSIGSFLNSNLVNRIYHFSSDTDVSDQKMLHWLSFANQEPKALNTPAKKAFGKDEFKTYSLLKL